MKVKKDKWKVNVRNVRKLIRFLKTIPPKMYDQQIVAVDADRCGIIKGKISCGGAACIAGWINSKFTNKKLEDFKAAGNFLGFKAKEGDEYWGYYKPQQSLFDAEPDGWPKKATKRYWNAKTDRGRLNAAIAALEQIAKDGRYEPVVTR